MWTLMNCGKEECGKHRCAWTQPIIGIFQHYVNVKIKKNDFQENFCSWRESQVSALFRTHRWHQTVARPGKRDQSDWWLACWQGKTPFERHLTLNGVATDSRCKKCGLEEETFHILCEYVSGRGFWGKVSQMFPSRRLSLGLCYTSVRVQDFCEFCCRANSRAQRKISLCVLVSWLQVSHPEA